MTSALLDQFIAEARDLVGQSSTALLALEKAPANGELVDAVFRAVHTLKGASDMVAVAPLTRLVHTGEDVLSMVRSARLSLSPDVVDLLLASLDQVGDWLNDLETDGDLPPDAANVASARIARLCAILDRGDEAPATAATDAETPPGDAAAWLDGFPEVDRLKALAHALKSGATIQALRYEPGAQAFFAGEDPLSLVGRIPDRLVTRASAAVPWPGLAELDPFLCNLVFEVLSSAPAEALTGLFDAIPHRVEIVSLTPPDLIRPAGDLADSAACEAFADAALRTLRADGDASPLAQVRRDAEELLRRTPDAAREATLLRPLILILAGTAVPPPWLTDLVAAIGNGAPRDWSAPREDSPSDGTTPAVDNGTPAAPAPAPVEATGPAETKSPHGATDPSDESAEPGAAPDEAAAPLDEPANTISPIATGEADTPAGATAGTDLNPPSDIAPDEAATSAEPTAATAAAPEPAADPLPTERADDPAEGPGATLPSNDSDDTGTELTEAPVAAPEPTTESVQAEPVDAQAHPVDEPSEIPPTEGRADPSADVAQAAEASSPTPASAPATHDLPSDQPPATGSAELSAPNSDAAPAPAPVEDASPTDGQDEANTPEPTETDTTSTASQDAASPVSATEPAESVETEAEAPPGEVGAAPTENGRGSLDSVELADGASAPAHAAPADAGVAEVERIDDASDPSRDMRQDPGDSEPAQSAGLTDTGETDSVAETSDGPTEKHEATDSAGPTNADAGLAPEPTPLDSATESTDDAACEIAAPKQTDGVEPPVTSVAGALETKPAQTDDVAVAQTGPEQSGEHVQSASTVLTVDGAAAPAEDLSPTSEADPAPAAIADEVALADTEREAETEVAPPAPSPDTGSDSSDLHQPESLALSEQGQDLAPESVANEQADDDESEPIGGERVEDKAINGNLIDHDATEGAPGGQAEGDEASDGATIHADESAGTSSATDRIEANGEAMKCATDDAASDEAGLHAAVDSVASSDAMRADADALPVESAGDPAEAAEAPSAEEDAGSISDDAQSDVPPPQDTPPQDGSSKRAPTDAAERGAAATAENAAPADTTPDGDGPDRTDPPIDATYPSAPSEEPAGRSFADADNPGAEVPMALHESATRGGDPASSSPVRGLSHAAKPDHPSEALASAASGGAAPRFQPKSAKSWRVEHAQIDRIGNLLGELKAANDTLPRLAGRASDLYGARKLARDLYDHHAAVAQITGALQDALVAVRMVPVRLAWQPLPRLVRDLSRKLGKPVDLVLEGDATEAEKAVIEVLADPLMHVLRNAVDHGIELPHLRAAAGKPTVGTIKLNAMHEGERLIVEIVDDGGGVDIERVKAKALAGGFIDAESAAAMDETRALDLVFAPGLSTCESVSDVSGRGVGLDVVRATIEQAGGTMSVASEGGKGTRVRLSLPMSVAAKRVMVVECANRSYALPTDLVCETVRVPEHSLHSLDNREVVILRDTLLPVVRLADRLRLRSRGGGGGEAAIVVVSIEQRPVAMVVDGFGPETETETIVKPLEGLMTGVGGYVGTATVGERQFLVLDMKELV